jgi:predicted permease
LATIDIAIIAFYFVAVFAIGFYFGILCAIWFCLSETGSATSTGAGVDKYY